jgi:hypothetical protein
MFSSVLIGVDGQSGGRDAIALATQLADPCSEIEATGAPGQAVEAGSSKEWA